MIERKEAVPGPAKACKLLKRVVDAAEKEGTSVNELQRMVDAPNGALYRLITGERGPSLALAVRMRDKWGIPVEAWIEGYRNTV